MILYSGNIGEKQGIEIIIEVAEALKESEVFFLIIGNGAFKKTSKLGTIEEVEKY